MSGIAGHLNFRTGAPVDPDILRIMGDLLAHRGPDGEGLWCQEAVGLAHRRLAIVDLTDAACQPMTAEDPPVWIVCNKEIYNFRELRTELEGRSPFLDHDVMEFCARLPSDLKLRGLTTKYLLKRAVRALLPAAAINRPKHGFGVPIAPLVPAAVCGGAAVGP